MTTAEYNEKVARLSKYHCDECTKRCNESCAAYRVILRTIAERDDAIRAEGVAA